MSDTGHSRLRDAITEACAHGQSPCLACQQARVVATVATLDRERIEALREIRTQIEHGLDATALVRLVTDALDGVPRDTRLDAATTMLAKCHTALRRVKTPRTDPDLLQQIVAYLAGEGIAVADE